MREETNEIVDSKITIHDQHRFEIKLDIDLPASKKGSYRVETYFFIPKALNINPNTFSKTEFYSAAQKYIRFKTPQISIPSLVDDKAEHSPYSRIKKELPALLGGTRDPEAINRVFNEIKLFGTVAKGAIRDNVKILLSDLSAARRSDGLQLRLPAIASSGFVFLQAVDSLFHSVQELRTELLNPVMPAKLREAYLFLDEFISLTIEDFMSTFLEAIRGNAGVPESLLDLDKKVAAAITRQQAHRKAMGYPSLIAEGTNNAVLIYRRSVLKKFISSILFLNLEVSEWDARTQVSFGIAAGFAMLFAAIVTVFAQNRFTTNSGMFITVVVIGYIFKDRLKDWLKFLFSKSMVRWIADRKIRIRDPFSNQIIGYFKEAFSFVEQTKVPPDVLFRRNMDNLTSIDEEGKPERIMKYQKEVFLFPERVARFHERRKDLNDIMRLNIDRFLLQADDPIVPYLHLDPSSGELQQLNCGRVYHVNMVFKYYSMSGDRQHQVSFDRIRLILNRNGIVRLNEVQVG